MNASEKKRYSISAKIFRTIIAGAVILGIVVLFIGSALYGVALTEQYIRLASDMSHQAVVTATHGADSVSLASEVMRRYASLGEELKKDPNDPAYRAVFSDLEETENYDVLLHMLAAFLENSEVYDVYIGMYDGENSRLIYVVDPDSIERMYPGQWESVRKKESQKFLSWNGEGMLYDVSPTEKYGWMCTAGTPLKDGAGKTVAFLLVDVTIGNVLSGMRAYVLQIAVALLIVTALMAFLLTRKMRREFVEPVNSIAAAAKSYVLDKRNGVNDKDHFQSLNIRTGDEIENLGIVMAEMERDLTDIEENLTEATAKNERISTELSLATRIQAAFIPHVFPPFPDRKEFDLYASMSPAKEVGGDFYDYYLIDDDHLCLSIADVSGKGIPAALFMMVSKIILQSCAMLGQSPAAILAKTNQAISSGNEEQMFLTVWIGILEISTGKLTAANAGHEYPMIRKPGGSYELLQDKHGFVIGGLEDSAYCEYELKLEPGSRIFVYTDGLPEASAEDGSMFGTERVLEVLNRDPCAAPERAIRKMSEAVGEFAGRAEQFDDLTMLCFEYKG